MGEAWTDEAFPIECLWNDAKKTLNQRTTTDTDTVTKVTIALTTGSLVMTNLSEVGRTLTIIHLIHDISHQQVVALQTFSSLKASQ